MADTDIAARVHDWYWTHDLNCARTMLHCLSQLFNVALEDQTLQAAIGMHGAGRFRAQCGLVEGALMFLGIYGTCNGMKDKEIAAVCFDYAAAFTDRFASLACRHLRPGGFRKEDPPHLCESLTVDAIAFTAEFIRGRNPQL